MIQSGSLKGVSWPPALSYKRPLFKKNLNLKILDNITQQGDLEGKEKSLVLLHARYSAPQQNAELMQ